MRNRCGRRASLHECTERTRTVRPTRTMADGVPRWSRSRRPGEHAHNEWRLTAAAQRTTRSIRVRWVRPTRKTVSAINGRGDATVALSAGQGESPPKICLYFFSLFHLLQRRFLINIKGHTDTIKKNYIPDIRFWSRRPAVH